jgi:hypothetical protein
MSAPTCATIGVPHEHHSRLAEFSSARFRLQYPPRQPTERSFGFSIPTFTFHSMRDQSVHDIKSMEGADFLWVEEAQNVSKKS